MAVDKTRRALLGLPLATMVGQAILAAGQSRQPNLTQLPPDLPRPRDDGGARHLVGMALPLLGGFLRLFLQPFCFA